MNDGRQIRKHKGSWAGEESTPNAYQEPLPQAKRLRPILQPKQKTQVTASHEPAQLKYVVLTSTWNSRSQRELTVNQLSGKLGADQAEHRGQLF